MTSMEVKNKIVHDLNPYFTVSAMNVIMAALENLKNLTIGEIMTLPIIGLDIVCVDKNDFDFYKKGVN